MSDDPDYVLSSHAREMLIERNISEDWLWLTIHAADDHVRGSDRNMHFLKIIQEMDNRVLRVIVNDQVTPKRIVTVFFDRRLTKE